MNKKIIAIAIATAMAAPVAMADVKVSGMLGGHLTMSDKGASSAAVDSAKSSREFGDAGIARIQFDGTTGKAFARMAYDMRPDQGAAGIYDTAGGTEADNLAAKPVGFAHREAYLGYNLGSSSFSFGRMAGVAKNLEKDPYIATFLQTRNTAAEATTAKQYGSSSFVDSVVQYSTKAGGMTVKIQLDPADNTQNSPNEGHVGLSAAGKSGAVGYWISYNTGQASEGGTSASHVNAKVGASMKMGTIKLTLNVTNSDDNKGTFGSSTSSALTANFNLGGGLSADVGYAANGDKGTWMRAAVSKNLAKGANVYGGLVSTTAAASGSKALNVMGVGMTVKF